MPVWVWKLGPKSAEGGSSGIYFFVVLLYYPCNCRFWVAINHRIDLVISIYLALLSQEIGAPCCGWSQLLLRHWLGCTQAAGNHSRKFAPVFGWALQMRGGTPEISQGMTWVSCFCWCVLCNWLRRGNGKSRMPPKVFVGKHAMNGNIAFFEN